MSISTAKQRTFWKMTTIDRRSRSELYMQADILYIAVIVVKNNLNQLESLW